VPSAATSPPGTDIDPADYCRIVETPNLYILRRIRPREATGARRLSPQPLGLKQAQNLGDLKQLLKPLQHLLQ
jgi:hypothetical protein